MMTREQLVAAAMALPEADRQDIADVLYQSLPGPTPTAKQIEELEQDSQAIARGEIAMTDADEVLRRLRSRARP